MSYNSCVNYEKDDYNEEKFSSFLGGIFLTRKTISNFDFLNLLETFKNKYNVYIIDDEFKASLDTGNSYMRVLDEYDDTIIYKNKKMTIREYLYLITSSNVREFFALDSDINQIINCNSLSKRKLLKRKNT